MSQVIHLNEELLNWTKIASSNTDVARADLAERLSQYFMDAPEGFSAKESTIVDELLSSIIKYAEKSLRSRLAKHVSAMPDPPAKLVQFLSSDDLDVAEPMLRACRALSEGDLIAAANDGGAGHRVLIAQRPDVTPAVGEALAPFAEEDMLRALLGNSSAELSRSALSQIVDHSEFIESIRKPLLARKDLPADLAHRMFWWVSSVLRVAILKRFKIHPDTLNEILAESVSDAVDKDHLLRRFEKFTPPRSKAYQLNEIIKDLRANRHSKLYDDFAVLLGVDDALSRRILDDENGESLAIACRAIGAEQDQFTSLYLLLDYKKYGRARPTGFFERAVAAYSVCDPEDAWATVQLWNTQETVVLAA